jgi:hypothetical protein
MGVCPSNRKGRARGACESQARHEEESMLFASLTTSTDTRHHVSDSSFSTTSSSRPGTERIPRLRAAWLCAEALLGLVLLGGCAHLQPALGSRHGVERLTREERADAIARARVWMPTDIPAMDLLAGPQGQGAFAANHEVVCDYVKEKLSGKSPKFDCSLGQGDVMRIKYGTNNAETFGEALATRLFWALGFGANRVYPVRVVCRGCTPDPWHDRRTVPGKQVFEDAITEQRMPGKTLESKKNSGWRWEELDQIDEARGGATRAQRDALRLLAVMVQHTDSKPEQQGLICLPGGWEKEGEGKRETCREPFMLVHDLGLTFGRANIFSLNSRGGVNYEEWARTPVWKNRERCVGKLSWSFQSTLHNPVISEEGRRFLADLLVKLSDRQIEDLFTAARVERRVAKRGRSAPGATVAEWVRTFKQKRDEIVSNTCPP